MATRNYQIDPLASGSMSRSPAPRRRATLASLAAELKVSRTTISNAYNRPDQLSADLRERVLAPNGWDIRAPIRSPGRCALAGPALSA